MQLRPLLFHGVLTCLLPGFPFGAVPGVAAQEHAPETRLEAAPSNESGPAQPCPPATGVSPYIPVDSWVYPAVMRLYAMGYAGKVYTGMRPWTRSSVSHMLEGTLEQIGDADLYGDSTAGEADALYSALSRELDGRASIPCTATKGQLTIESSYSTIRAISGTPLHDSFHLGSTIVNDYGRPYESGFSNYSGLSGYASAGRFLIYARGEFQGAASATGYSTALATTLTTLDIIPYINPATGLPTRLESVPLGPIATTTQGRFLEAYAQVHLAGHDFSFGKQDDWLGPGVGAGMAYSNNAENIYSFRINRTEPLDIPLLSRLTGPFRYDFLVGKLRGHTWVPNPVYDANPSSSVANVISPGDPWVHVEKFSFRPTRDLEFGWERTVIWGGKGHEPITMRTFLKSFFSTTAADLAVKNSRQDPGARFGAFDFSYRLPFPRNWLTLYTDSEAHDSPSPIAKPYHGCFRPGLYLSHVPGIPRLDARFEATDTDSSYPLSIGGRYQYWEVIQVQGYTNNGQIFGDWIGREGKGGQGWLTYHLSGNEWIQLELRNQKNAKDFIPGGTTLNDATFRVVKRIGKDLEINGAFTFERYKAPIYLPGAQTVTATTIQLTWFPERRVNF
jgi:hypothetical protein